MSGFGNFGICNFVPFLCQAVSGDSSTIDPTQSQRFLTDRIQLLLALVFAAIILISVFVIVRAGVLYIQSQGEEGKIQEAQKAIRNVFIGIAVMFVGVVGIVLVLAFFNATSLLEGVDGTGSGCRITAAGTVECDNDT